jgi:hypothetical protein
MSAPAADLAPYERRAAEAEARLDALETAMTGGARAAWLHHASDTRL